VSVVQLRDLCHGKYFKVAEVASCWQREQDLIGSVFEPIPLVLEADVLPLVLSDQSL